MTDVVREIVAYCQSEPHASHQYKETWEADVFTLGGKMFAMVGSYKDGRPIVTLKAEPEKSEALREAYEGIVIPGYYANKKHWISIFLDTKIDIRLPRAWIDDSYELVLHGLSKKERTALS